MTTRLEQIQRIAWYEEVARKANAVAAEMRAELAEEAVDEYRRTGTAPTWRVPDVFSVTLPLSKRTCYVSDPDRFRSWVAARYPHQVETVRQVRGAWQGVFLKGLSVDGDVAFDAEGEVVPGVSVRAGGVPGSLTIRLSDDVKGVLALHAGEGLRRLALEAGPEKPVEVAG